MTGSHGASRRVGACQRYADHASFPAAYRLNCSPLSPLCLVELSSERALGRLCRCLIVQLRLMLCSSALFRFRDKISNVRSLCLRKRIGTSRSSETVTDFRMVL